MAEGDSSERSSSRAGWFFPFLIGLAFGMGPCTPSACKLIRERERELVVEKILEPYWIDSSSDLNGDDIPDVVLKYRCKSDLRLYSSKDYFGRVTYEKRF